MGDCGRAVRLAGGMAFVVPGIAAVGATMAATASPVAASQPTNLLVGDQASFTNSTGGWVGTGATTSWVSSLGDSAPGALEVTATGGQGMSAASGSPVSGGLVEGTPGLVYAGSFASVTASSPQGIESVLAFYASSGALLTAAFGASTEVVAGHDLESRVNYAASRRQ